MSIASYFFKPTSTFCVRKDEGKSQPVIKYNSFHNKLVREVKREHYLYSKKGYAMHECLLNLMIKQCGKDTPLEIITETGKTYTAPLERWQAEGIKINFSGPQICLPITKMEWGKVKEKIRKVHQNYSEAEYTERYKMTLF